MKISISMAFNRKQAISKLQNFADVLCIHLMLFLTQKESKKHWLDECVAFLGTCSKTSNLKKGFLTKEAIQSSLFTNDTLYDLEALVVLDKKKNSQHFKRKINFENLLNVFTKENGLYDTLTTLLIETRLSVDNTIFEDRVKSTCNLSLEEYRKS